MGSGAHRLEQPRGLGRPVAQGHQGTEGLGLGARGSGRDHRTATGPSGGQPVAHLDDETLRGLAANAGNARERRSVLGLHGLGERFSADSREQGQSNFRSHSGDLDETAKQLPLVLRTKRIEDVRVLTNDQVSQQPHLLAYRGEMKIRGHRRLRLVADPAHLHGELRGRLGSYPPAHRSDHVERTAAPRASIAIRREWAWHTATAKASEASGLIFPVSRSRILIICATCSFSAAPDPTRASLIARGAYSNTGRPRGTAQSAAPRA